MKTWCFKMYPVSFKLLVMAIGLQLPMIWHEFSFSVMVKEALPWLLNFPILLYWSSSDRKPSESQCGDSASSYVSPKYVFTKVMIFWNNNHRVSEGHWLKLYFLNTVKPNSYRDILKPCVLVVVWDQGSKIFYKSEPSSLLSAWSPWQMSPGHSVEDWNKHLQYTLVAILWGNFHKGNCHLYSKASVNWIKSGLVQLWLHWVIFFSFIFISWRLISLQYCSFCHTLTWISHRFTCVPHPDPLSHLPPHPIPLGLPSAPALSTYLMHPTWAGDLFHPW